MSSLGETNLNHGVTSPLGDVSIADLKVLFADHLRDAEKLKSPAGVSTGLEALDQFLLWKGLPKGALTLLSGSLGTGATSLWINAAAHATKQGRWVAWINREVPLFPLPLKHRGIDLGRFVSVEEPDSDTKLFWLLGELMSSSLFELIGCDLGVRTLREHQLRKLQVRARDAQISLVLLNQTGGLNRRTDLPKGSMASIFSLIVSFQRARICVERAQHRSTPHSFPRSLFYDNDIHNGRNVIHYSHFTLHTADRLSFGASSSHHAKREPHSLPQTPRGLK